MVAEPQVSQSIFTFHQSTTIKVDLGHTQACRYLQDTLEPRPGKL